MRSLSPLAACQSRDSRPLASLLPYVACGEVQGFKPIHLFEDGSFGFGLEFDIPVVDTQVDGEEGVSRLIDEALRRLPDGVYWQWFLRSNPCVEPQLRLYAGQQGNDPIAQACTSHYVKRWRNAQRDGFFPDEPDANFFPKSQSILVALKSPPLPITSMGIATPFRRKSAADSLLSSFVEASKRLQAALAAQGLHLSPLCADRLANWVIDLLFPWRCLAHPPVRTGLNSVREAIGSVGVIDSIHLRGFRTVSAGTEAHHRIVSMLWHPRVVRPGMLNELGLLRPCLSVSLTARLISQTSSTLQLKTQSLLNARLASRFNEIETLARTQALSNVEQRLFAEGERLVEARLQVHIVERSADMAEEAARHVCSYLQEREIESAPEEDIGSSLILRGCLPFAVYEATERKLLRQRRFLSRDLADIHPAGGCWKGISPSSEAAHAPSAPIVMYSNPVGEPLFLDPSKAERNPHALVVGQSGSGKSFFVHDYLLQLWRLPHVRLYLISIKPDYRKLALLLGRYVELTLDSVESLNPFAGPPTLENQARWVAALSLMITEGRPNHYLSREQQIALQESASAASARNWNSNSGSAIRETILEDICLELERRTGSLGRNLAFQLLPYRRGPFHRLFNRARTLSVDDRFVFFNLGNILRQPCSAAVSFCVFSLIDQVMHEDSLKAIPKGLIADEVWALVQDPSAATILERSLKAYRSLGGFAVPIVQDPRDLDTPAGRAILVNTATKILLPMDRSGQDDISRFVPLNDRELALVRGLRLVKRCYGEFFVSIEGIHSAKGVLIPDPLRYAISTTDPFDEAELNRLYEQSGDMSQAVEEFARSRPYGVEPNTVRSDTARGYARWSVIVLTLTAAIAIAVVSLGRRSDRHSLPPPTSPVHIIEAESVAEKAAELLVVSPGPPRPDVFDLSNAKLGESPPHETSHSAPPADLLGESTENLSTLIQSLAALRDREPQTLAPSSLSTPVSVQAARTTPAGKLEEKQPLIPDRIENPPANDAADPLQNATVKAELLSDAAARSPWTLLEVRLDSTPTQARLARLVDGKSIESGWHEAGDSLSQEWILVSVDADFATLMSTHGSLIRLSVQMPPRTLGKGEKIP